MIKANTLLARLSKQEPQKLLYNEAIELLSAEVDTFDFSDLSKLEYDDVENKLHLKLCSRNLGNDFGAFDTWFNIVIYSLDFWQHYKPSSKVGLEAYLKVEENSSELIINELNYYRHISI